MTRRDELNPNKKHTEKELDFIDLLYDNDTYTEERNDGIDTVALDCNDGKVHAFKTRYAVGEIVAIKQSYKDCGKFDAYQAPINTKG